VTPEGALWRWDGFRAEAGSAAAGARRIEQRNRLAELVQELKATHQSAAKAAELFEAAKEVRAEAEQLDADSRAAAREARRAVDSQRAALREAEQRAARIGERLSAFAGALARIDADTDASRVEARSAADALASIPDGSALTTRRDELQGELAELRGKAAETRLEAEKAAHEEVVRSRRAAEIVDERERWAKRVARAEERVAELTARLASLDGEISALADDPEAFQERRRGLAAVVASAEQEASAAGEKLAEAEGEHRRLADAADAAREALAQARERRARDEERVLGAAARKTELAAQIAEHFDRPPEELGQLAEVDPDEPLPPAAAAESRLHKLRAERERLGGVNLRAEDEARELEVRLDAMRAEHEDLEEAVKRLRQGIQNLNREARERLLAAFEQVNGHIRSLFQHLFGGGTAELTLIDSEDPLEAGLEIVARPPGKRPATMTLLSGGEQALTALALLFAVFLTNPSPICVLDEVDAPLDDANVERFCALLDDMRQRTDTRFVVVTHNPITMARMDRLYGVTMAERGVSQIVSVDLQAAERFREAS
jgi:chromosome segregation protein